MEGNHDTAHVCDGNVEFTVDIYIYIYICVHHFTGVVVQVDVV